MKNLIDGEINSSVSLGIPEHIVNADVYIPPYFEKEGTRLYMNENLFGPSPKCIDVLSEIDLSNLYQYAYGRNDFIEEKIAENVGLTKENVLVNNGSSDVLQLIMDTMLESGDTVLLPDPGWSYYSGVVRLDDCNVEKFELEERPDFYVFNEEELIDCINQFAPKIVLITSPNMPTGNKIEEDQLVAILESMKTGVLILDEAYYGFSEEDIDINRLIKTYPNFVVVRTFSKMYGLASLRIGYMLCSEELKEMFNKKAPLFGISYITQKVAAAALDDKEYYEQMQKKVEEVRNRFMDEVDLLDSFHCFRSCSNFILIKVYEYAASDVVAYLKANGYLVRDCKGYGLKDCIRISVGREEHMCEILELLRRYPESK